MELAGILIVLMLHSALIKFWSILVIIPSLLNREDKLGEPHFSLSLLGVLFLFVSFGKDFVFNERDLCPQLFT